MWPCIQTWSLHVALAWYSDIAETVWSNVIILAPVAIKLSSTYSELNQYHTLVLENFNACKYVICCIFPGGSNGEESAAMQETWVQFLG